MSDGDPRGYDESHYTETKNGVSYWVERFFFAGIELTVLSTPAFVPAVLFQYRYPDALPLAGIAAIVAGAASLTLYRTGVVDVGAWPRLGEFGSAPLRVTYFSAVFLAATFGVAGVTTVLSGSLGLAFVSGGVVQALGFAGFPTVYRSVYGDPVRHPAQRA